MSLTETVKRVLPEWAFVRAVRLNRRWRAPAPLAEGRRAYARLGSPTTVRGGPFAGMAYVHEASGSLLAPKLLGTYELEVHPAIEAMVARRPDVVVDVGAAEGYYAVGMARRVPAARVVAYDTDRYARHLLHRMVAANGVGDRVRVAGHCTAADLEATIAPAARPAVISDCEGFEDHLLAPDVAPALRRADVLVEVHGAVAAGVGDRLRQRFAATHHIQAVAVRPRLATDGPADTGLPTADLRDALDEHRWDPSGWLYLTPLATR